MDASFWHKRWGMNQIGFHESKANPLLVKHIDKLNLPAHGRVFLPLCGKTLDIDYLLERGHHIAGIELSEIAIKALFDELKLSPTITNIGALKRYQAHNIEILVGDFFDLTADILGKLGKVDAIYDRAALIALPPETRKRYTKHLIEITDTAPQLIICLEYDQAIIGGPPFSIVPSELEQHYKDSYLLDCVESISVEKGLKGKYPAKNSAWVLEAN